jgi:hypothetical protein
MGLFGLSIGGAVDGMKTMLKNNEIIKNKVQHFSNKDGAKYKNNTIKVEEVSPEEIIRIRQKIKKQERFLVIKKLLVLLVSFGIVIFLFLLISNKI